LPTNTDQNNLGSLSFGDSTDLSQVEVTSLHLYVAEDPRSQDSTDWEGPLQSLKERGSQMAYTDGTGADGGKAAGFFTEGLFLGTLALVSDAEQAAIALALEATQGLTCILSDSQTALATVSRLAGGGAPRLLIERRLKAALKGKSGEVGICWVRRHVGTPGNEEADGIAALFSSHGGLGGDPVILTPEGLRKRRKALQVTARQRPGYGVARTSWETHPLAPFTWLRTNRGLQRSWLHHRYR